MSDVELPAEPETPNPFAMMTGEQITEHFRKLAAAMTPGERARMEAQKVVDKLALEVPSGRLDIVATPTELERRRQMNNLGAAYCAIDGWFDFLSVDCPASIFVYTNLKRLIESAYELGKFSGPDGVKAREQKTEKARARAQTIFMAVKHYLANPQIPRSASLKGAADIKSAIEKILGFKVSLSELTKALCKLRKESLKTSSNQ